MTSPARTHAADPVLVRRGRRRVLAVMSFPLVAGGLLSGWPRHVSAASVVPPQLATLDAAATALFDAAENRQWHEARSMLTSAKAAAQGAASLLDAFVEAGGELHRYYQAINSLSGDLVEAETALSVKDARWLVSAADRIVSRAGELSQPFAERSGSLAQRVEVLLFLARRMRRALVWSDSLGFRSARDDFRRLWHEASTQSSTLPPDTRRALDDALTNLSRTNSAREARDLQRAVEALRR